MSPKAPDLADVAAETAVLGCMLCSGDADGARAMLESTGPLQPEAFTEHRRHVWEAMTALVQDRHAVDHLTVSEKLKSRGVLAACGGPAGLMALDNGVPYLHNLASYVAILRDRAMRREVLTALERARADLYNMEKAPDVVAASVANTLGRIRSERKLRKGGQLVYRVLDKWDSNRKAESEGQKVTPCLPWPHEGMDTGVPRGRVTVVAGRSGNFKSGLVSDGMYFWAKSMQEPGGLIGLEDGCDWFIERLTGRAVDVPYEQVGFARLNEAQEMRLADWCSEAHGVLEERMFFEDYSETGVATSMVSFPEVFADIQRMVDGGAKWVVIDHGLRIDWLKGASTDRYDMAIGQGMARCSRYAERTGVAIVFLWHLNRAQQEGTVPQRSDLKESGYVDAEARKIYVLWKQAHRQGVQLCTTVKATKGEEGFTVALPMRDAMYGLLSRTGGTRVDFAAEAAEAKARADEARNAKRGTHNRVRLFGGDK